LSQSDISVSHVFLLFLLLVCGYLQTKKTNVPRKIVF
jgi:hypothetical protein